MSKTAVIYTRISQDRLGESESPQRQEEDCRALADRHGYVILEVYSDRDASAYQEKSKRPAYYRMLNDLTARRADVLVAWKLDRLTRRGLTGIAPILDLVVKNGLELVLVQDSIDTSTPMGRSMVGMLASMAEQESLNMSARVRSAFHHGAKNGRGHHGGNRKFGREIDGTVRLNEAEVVRELVKRTLAGETFRGLAADLNRRGVTTSTGKEWGHTSVASTVKAPHIAGLRIVDGAEVVTDLEPIITPEQRREVLTILTRPRRDRSGDRPKLLAGVIRCHCGMTMKHVKQSNGYSRYICIAGPYVTKAGCGKVVIGMDSVDRYVVSKMLDVLALCELRPLEGETDEPQLQAELADAKEFLDQLVEQRYVERPKWLTTDRFEKQARKLQLEVDRLESRLDALRRGREDRQRNIPLGDREALQRWWDESDNVERRAAVRWALTWVEVRPATRRGSVFDTSRIHVEPNWSILTWNHLLKANEKLVRRDR